MKNNFLQRMNKWGIFDLGGVRKMSGECRGNVGRGLAWNFFTRVGGRSGEMKSNHAIITRLSRNNHLMLLRGIRYAAMLLTVLMVGTGEMWGETLSTTTYGTTSHGYLNVGSTTVNGTIKASSTNVVSFGVEYLNSLSSPTWFSTSASKSNGDGTGGVTVTNTGFLPNKGSSGASFTQAYSKYNIKSNAEAYFWVTGTTGVSIIGQGNGSSKYIVLHIDEVGADGTTLTAVGSNVTQKNTAAIITHGSTLTVSKYYKVTVTADNTSNNSFFQIRFSKASFTLTPTLTNVTRTDANGTKLTGDSTFTATFTANDGYTLPSDVTVTIGGDVQTKGTGYNWSVSAGVGTLTFPALKVTGNVAVSITGESAAPSNDYVYHGADNSWGTTDMTVSEGGLYEYYQTTTNNHQFLIKKGETIYNKNYNKAGFCMTDVSTLGDYSSYNCYIWDAPESYYIIVFKPETDLNGSSSPVICASTTLPDDTEEGLAATKRIFLVPNSNWTQSSAKFAVKYTGHDGEYSDYMTELTCESGHWYVDMPALYSDIQFCRMNPESTRDDDGRWNYSSTLRLSASNNCYTIANDAWSDASTTGSSYAVPTYTLSYDANKGSGSMSDETGIACNGSQTLTTNAFTRSGWTFKGWDTNKYGGGTSYDNQATIENITSNITLYAQWERTIYLRTENASWWADNAKLTIHYWDGSATSNSDDVVMERADECSDPRVYKATISGGGYNKLLFYRLNPSNDAVWTQTVDLDFNDTYDMYNLTHMSGGAGDKAYGTFSSSYSAPTYTISFKAGSGSGSMSNIENIACEGNQTIPANGFTYTGYTFAGWVADVDITVNSATVEVGDPIDDETTIQNISSDITLTAQWTAGQYNVTPTLTNITKASGTTGTNAATYGVEYSATFTADEGYELPSDVTVTIGGAAQTKGTGYTWTVSEGVGTFTIPAVKVTGAITLGITGVAKTYSITYNKGANGTGTISGGSKTHGVAYALSTSTFTRAGYVQTGWSLTDGGAKAYNLGGSYTTNAAQEFYPFWSEVTTYTATFSYDSENPAAAPDGWTFANAGTYGASDATVAYITAFGDNCPAPDSLKSNSDNVAFAKNSSAYAKFDIGYATTITTVTGHFNVGSGNARTFTITYLGSDNSVKHTVTINHPASSNWGADFVNETAVVSDVRYIKVNQMTSSSINWIIMQTFSVKYADLTPKYAVTHTLTNITATSGATGDLAAKKGTAYNAVFAAADGYALPSSIDVTIGGESATVTTDYTWNSSTGAFQVPAAKVTGAIVVTIEGLEITGHAITNGNPSNGIIVITDGADEIASADEGDEVHISATPNTGYEFTSWSIYKTDDEETTITPEEEEDETTFTMPGYDVTVDATFSAIDYTITHSSASNGTYTIQVGEAEAVSTNTTANYGQTITLAATPSSGYTFSSWTVTDEDEGDVEVTDNTFTMPAKAVTVSATFEEIKYTVTYDANGGSCATTSATQASSGASITLATPTREGCTFEGWYDKLGNKIGSAEASFTPTRDTTLYAHFIDDIEGKVFSAIDGDYGVKFKAFDLSGWVSSNQTGKSKTYTNTTTGVQFEVDDGAWDNKNNAISALAKFIGDATSMSIVIPSGKVATVKISYSAYGTGDNYRLTVNTTPQLNPTTKFDDKTITTNAQVYAALKEITLENQTGTLTLGISNTDKNLYIGRVSAVITSLTYDEEGDGDWDNEENWGGTVPTINTSVVIPENTEITVKTGVTAKAKEIDLGEGAKLTVQAGGALIVANTISKDGAATSVEDLRINSTLEDGTGALVMGNHNGTNRATVQFATKAYCDVTYGHGYINQYIGTPFNNETNILQNYYNSWIYAITYEGGVPGWNDRVEAGEGLHPFEGYDLMRPETTQNVVLSMEGTLVSSDDVTLTSSSSPVKLTYNGSSNTENVLANSWMAPIKIKAFEESDFTNMEATIYIFNAGSTYDAGQEGPAGNYSTYPIDKADATDVIPSMQSFSVYATAASPSLKLDYSKLVYDPAVAGLAVQPNFAPRRAKAEAMTSLKLRVAGESGFADELKVYVHDDFDEGFENGWDGHKMYGYPEAPQLYAVTQDGEMAVNCVPDAESMLIGLKAGTKDQQYTMTFEYDDAEPLYMVDTKTNTYTQVMTGNEYTFQTNDLGAHSRFILTHYAPQMPTDLEPTSDSSLKGRERGLKFIEGEKMFILMNGVLYDATGRRVEGVRE